MKRTIMKSFGAIVLALVHSISAAPSVQGVVGNVANRSSITINGTGFGANGPVLEVFDDFEGGTNGTNIKTGTGSATVGEWSGISGRIRPKYSHLEALSGQQSFRADFTTDYTSQIQRVFSEPILEFFGCWWWMIPTGTNIPGEGGVGINWKTVWIMDGFQGTDDDLILPVILGTVNTVTGHRIGGNTAVYNEWAKVTWRKGEWKRIWCWLKASTNATGQVHMWELINSGVNQLLDDNNVQVLSSSSSSAPHEWEQIHINAYGKQASNCYPTFDDIYLATGPNARARIEIGNAPTYASCTKLTLCTPDSWSSTAVTATVRAGQFKTGDGAFLYVFDAGGACNAVGHPVEFVPPQPSSIRALQPVRFGIQNQNMCLYDPLGRCMRGGESGLWANGVGLTINRHSTNTKQRLVISR